MLLLSLQHYNCYFLTLYLQLPIPKIRYYWLLCKSDIIVFLDVQILKLIHFTEVYHFHDMIEMLVKCGYKKGTTLFGYGYDFRQSNRYFIF